MWVSGAAALEILLARKGILRLSILSSGSSGNATCLESGGRGVLVDAGMSYRRIRALLRRVGRDLDDIGAVLLTHGHSDHTAGVNGVLRECGAAIYAPPGVRDGACPVEPGGRLELDGLEAAFFEVPHDSPTYGLRVSDGERTAALATDLGEVTPGVLCWMRGAEAVVLEANHDPQWLRRGPYPAELKRRISSPTGHLSNHQAAETALDLAPHGLRDLTLAHLSRTNNSPVRATGAVHHALREAGYGGVRVRAAIAGHPTPWIEVGAPVEQAEYTYRQRAGQLFELE